jgi:hypothetical protein
MPQYRVYRVNERGHATAPPQIIEATNDGMSNRPKITFAEMRASGVTRLRCPGGSRDRTKSPAAVSAKREYSRIGPETIRDLASRNSEMGGWRPAARSRKAVVCGHFFRSLGHAGDWCTGWLTIQGSNSHILDPNTVFEMSGQFRLFPRSSGLETFAPAAANSR